MKGTSVFLAVLFFALNVNADVCMYHEPSSLLKRCGFCTPAGVACPAVAPDPCGSAYNQTAEQFSMGGNQKLCEIYVNSSSSLSMGQMESFLASFLHIEASVAKTLEHPTLWATSKNVDGSWLPNIPISCVSLFLHGKGKDVQTCLNKFLVTKGEAALEIAACGELTVITAGATAPLCAALPYLNWLAKLASALLDLHTNGRIISSLDSFEDKAFHSSYCLVQKASEKLFHKGNTTGC